MVVGGGGSGGGYVISEITGMEGEEAGLVGGRQCEGEEERREGDERARKEGVKEGGGKLYWF